MSAHTITHLVHVYGYAIVFAAAGLQALGAPLPGTTVLVAAAVYASTAHGLSIVGVIAAGAGGVLLGTSIAYALGRWGGERLLVRLPARLRRSPDFVDRLRDEFAAHGGAWVFVGRFVTGLRNVTGLVAGACGMAARRFVAISAAAALAWAALNGLQYYWFGRALAGASTWVQIVLVVAGLAWMVISLRFLHRRAAKRLRATAG